MKIIFHYPLPLDYRSATASGIRPVRMLDAFKALGFDVTVVAGYGAERKAAIKKLEAELKSGALYEFCYSESSTQPTLLTERHHLPLYPMLDFGLFSLLKKKNIPVGLFYRDIYWLFDEYKNSLSPIKAIVAKFFYRYDLYKYQSLVKILYLPSCQMAPYIPMASRKNFLPSPPGHSVVKIYNSDAKPENEPERSLRLLYIGGMSDFYQMHALFNSMPIEGVELTVCTRIDEWKSVREAYPNPDDLNIKVVHESGEGLDALYLEADIGVLFVMPDEYWAFSEPFKLYEYLGNSKPIIVSEGTLAAKFVKENNIGWTVPYSANDLKNLLLHLRKHPEEIAAAKMRCQSVASRHTWLERAKKVANDLSVVSE